MSMGMGMSMSQSQDLRQTLDLRENLVISFGENSGDIPLYSLHRISNLLRKNPIRVSVQLNEILKRRLVAANMTYKNESGNNWNCLTSLNLVSAIEGTDHDVKQITTGPGAIPVQHADQAEEITKVFDEYRIKATATIQSWFEVNFDDLLYITDGKIPWAVVQRLRRNLGEWITSGSNPFHQGIEEMILDVAKDNGVTVETAEDAWQLLGGTLFK